MSEITRELLKEQLKSAADTNERLKLAYVLAHLDIEGTLPVGVTTLESINNIKTTDASQWLSTPISQLDGSQQPRFDGDLFAQLLTGCLDGNEEATAECRQRFSDLNSITGVSITDLLTVKPSVARMMLKRLGFKELNEPNLFNNSVHSRFESIEDWVKRTGAEIGPESSPLNQVIKAFHTFGSLEYSPDRDTNLCKDFALFRNDVVKREDLLLYLIPFIGTRVVTMFGGSYQAGGGFVNDTHFSSDIDANRSMFKTASILRKFFNKYIDQLTHKGIQVNDVDEIKTLINTLEKHEESLVNLVSLMDKTYALVSYYGADHEGKIAHVNDMVDLVKSNEKVFNKVRSERGRIMAAISLMDKYIS